MVAQRYVAWLVGYGVFVALIVGALWHARGWALAELDHPAARAQWEQWKQEEAARVATSDSPVTRRIPRSSEPPILVILRDHFVAVLVSCLVIGSFLFTFLALVIRGVSRGSSLSAERGTHS